MPSISPHPKRRKNKTYWYARVKRRGEKTTEHYLKGVKSREEARQHCQLLEAQIAEGLNPFGADVSLEAWVESYISALRGSKQPKAEGTIKGERVSGRKLVKWLAELYPHVRRPHQITAEILLEFQDDCLDNCEGRTMNLHRSYLSNLFEWSRAEGLVTGNPAKEIPFLEHFSAERPIFERETVEVLLSSLSPLHRIAFLCQYNAHLRPTEMCRLEWADFDSVRNCINVVNKLRHLSGKKRRVEKTKTGVERHIAVEEELIRSIRELEAVWGVLTFLTGQPKPRLVFCSLTGSPLTYRSWNDALAKACSESGIEKRITGYQVRHSSATHAADEGTSIEVLQERLGHMDIQMTRRYIRVSGERQRKASDTLKVGGYLEKCR